MSRENAGSSARAVTRNGRISLAPMSEPDTRFLDRRTTVNN
jgi:hypothetical protein